MNDAKQVAASVVGAIDWETGVSGFCHCPGETLHTQRSGVKDCRVTIDGAPTIHCFHASCVNAVADANKRLRSALGGGGDWSVILPDGEVLRPGDPPRSNGEVLPRTAMERGAWNGEGGMESLVLETTAARAEQFKPELFERYHWPLAKIIEDSPLLVGERDPEDQFRTWLKLWPAHSHVWIGDVYSSGREEHRTHFRPVSEWYQIGPVMGNFTCGSAFKPGCYQRSNENIEGQRFLVIESDTLSKDEVGAVFNYLRRRLQYRLHCIIDTGGKSLHGWFDAPRNKLMENRLKVGLTALGCDPKTFTYSQPVRVPGAFREGKLQRLIWLND